MFCEGPTLLGKVCPKEGTRVRVLGVYHDTAWYGAVGHRGSRGRGSGVAIGERRSGIWQVVPGCFRISLAPKMLLTPWLENQLSCVRSCSGPRCETCPHC